MEAFCVDVDVDHDPRNGLQYFYQAVAYLGGEGKDFDFTVNGKTVEITTNPTNYEELQTDLIYLSPDLHISGSRIDIEVRHSDVPDSCFTNVRALEPNASAFKEAVQYLLNAQKSLIFDWAIVTQGDEEHYEIEPDISLNSVRYFFITGIQEIWIDGLILYDKNAQLPRPSQVQAVSRMPLLTLPINHFCNASRLNCLNDEVRSTLFSFFKQYEPPANAHKTYSITYRNMAINFELKGKNHFYLAWFNANWPRMSGVHRAPNGLATYLLCRLLCELVNREWIDITALITLTALWEGNPGLLRFYQRMGFYLVDSNALSVLVSKALVIGSRHYNDPLTHQVMQSFHGNTMIAWVNGFGIKVEIQRISHRQWVITELEWNGQSQMPRNNVTPPDQLMTIIHRMLEELVRRGVIDDPAATTLILRTRNRSLWPYYRTHLGMYEEVPEYANPEACIPMDSTIEQILNNCTHPNRCFDPPRYNNGRLVAH